MATLESVGNVLSADILVIGGGIAGLCAAISAKEASPEIDVLVVDKVVSGWGGKANKGGGNIAYVCCVVVEDAYAGIEAALAAGMKAFAVRFAAGHPNAHGRAESLETVSAAQLINL